MAPVSILSAVWPSAGGRGCAQIFGTWKDCVPAEGHTDNAVSRGEGEVNMGIGS